MPLPEQEGGVERAPNAFFLREQCFVPLVCLAPRCGHLVGLQLVAKSPLASEPSAERVDVGQAWLFPSAVNQQPSEEP